MNNPIKKTIRISLFKLDGNDMVDIRYWRNTLRGPRATSKAIEIDQRLLTRLIHELQKAHAGYSSLAAKSEAGIQS